MERKDVGHEIHSVSNLLGRKIDEEKRLRGMSDVTPVQIWIIRYLYDRRERDIFQRDIERDFTITRSTVTGILKLMEKKGYITRVNVPEDARLKKIILTEKGSNLRNQVVNHIEESERRLVRGMTEEEIDTFLELLRKIKENLL